MLDAATNLSTNTGQNIFIRLGIQSLDRTSLERAGNGVLSMKFSWNDIDNDSLNLRLAMIVIILLTTKSVCVRAVKLRTNDSVLCQRPFLTYTSQ
jgi:hypothetical protein